MEPDYLAQTGECKSQDEINAWLRHASADARSAGCVHGRATWSEEHQVLLYEAWKERPKDEGEPRFLLQYAAAESETPAPPPAEAE